MVDLDSQIKDLDREALLRVDSTLKRINVALKLNAPKLRTKPVPTDLKKLLKWKQTLDYWKERYGYETEDVEFMAERLGAFYEVCTTMQ